VEGRRGIEPLVTMPSAVSFCSNASIDLLVPATTTWLGAL
jgi:hypothetical protein